MPNTSSKVTVSARITEELDEQLRAEARAQDRSLSWLIERALKDLLGKDEQ